MTWTFTRALAAAVVVGLGIALGDRIIDRIWPRK